MSRRPWDDMAAWDDGMRREVAALHLQIICSRKGSALRASLREQRERAETVLAALDRVLRHAPARGPLYQEVVGLAHLFGRTIPCPRCGGRGQREKCPIERCNHDCQDRMINDCYGLRECRRCQGIGRLPRQPDPAA